MESRSATNVSVSYRRGRDNANADFLSILLLSSTEEDISDSCALSDPDEFGVYFIRALDLVPSPCPITGICLGELGSPVPTSTTSGLDERIPQLDPLILGGIPLTHDDFGRHRAPFLLPHMIGFIDLPYLMFAKNPRPPSENISRTILGLLVQDAHGA